MKRNFFSSITDAEIDAAIENAVAGILFKQPARKTTLVGFHVGPLSRPVSINKKTAYVVKWGIDAIEEDIA